MLREFVTAQHENAGRHLDHITARLALAETTHTAGSCGAAIHHATLALDTYLAGQGDERPEPAGVWFLLQTLRLLALCGRADEAIALIGRWRPWLPTGESRVGARLLGAFYLGVPGEIEDHPSVCAARLGDQFGLADRPAGCAVHQAARRDAVRRAFLAALDEPENATAGERPAVRCACTSVRGRRPFAVEPMLDAVILRLVRLRRWMAVRQVRRMLGAAEPPTEKNGPADDDR